jgi:hypothetical protein
VPGGCLARFSFTEDILAKCQEQCGYDQLIVHCRCQHASEDYQCQGGQNFLTGLSGAKKQGRQADETGGGGHHDRSQSFGDTHRYGARRRGAIRLGTLHWDGTLELARHCARSPHAPAVTIATATTPGSSPGGHTAGTPHTRDTRGAGGRSGGIHGVCDAHRGTRNRDE